MRGRHEQDIHKMNEKLEREVVAEEAQAVELLEADKERKLRELKDRHAAELVARSKDMSPEEVQQVFEERCLFWRPGIDCRFFVIIPWRSLVCRAFGIRIEFQVVTWNRTKLTGVLWRVSQHVKLILSRSFVMFIWSAAFDSPPTRTGWNNGKDGRRKATTTG